jgi:carbonic anhydrase
MCELCRTNLKTITTPAARLSRRNVLKFAAATSAAAALAGSTPRAFADPVKTPPKPENALTPEAALIRLMKGNTRYVEGVTGRYDFRSERAALSGGQNPFAAILGCADSRIAPEFCFDTARGDVFICRVAGNFATDEMIASMEYAVQVLNTPLIMVLGHDACGAIDATIKSIRDGTTLPGHLPSLVHALTPAVQAVQGQAGDQLANAISKNVALNVDKLKSATPILKSFVDDNKVHVIGGVYRLKTGKVELLS